MALTAPQRDAKYLELKDMRDDKLTNQERELLKALRRRNFTSGGTSERAEADKAVTIAVAAAGL